MATDNTIINIANDLGYGFVKASLNNNNVSFPSMVGIQNDRDALTPRDIPNKQQLNQEINQLMDNMNVSINSDAVSTAGNFLVGAAAANQKLPDTRTFDIVNTIDGKSRQSDLSEIITLSMIAAERVMEANKAGQDIFNEELKTEVNMVTALPIQEAKLDGVKENYAHKFTDSSHIVIFNNYRKRIRVNINFKNVFVAREGEAAQFAILHADDTMKKAIQASFAKNYPSMVDDSDYKDITQNENAIIIDIGEGTTDIVSTIDGKANSRGSVSIPNGYGRVLDQAVFALQNANMPFYSKDDIHSFLDNASMPQRRKKRVKDIVKQKTLTLSSDIITALTKILNLTNLQANVVYVCGGGSIPMSKSNLQKELNDALQHFYGGEEYSIPVVWIPKKYAQLLNLIGLKQTLNILYAK